MSQKPVASDKSVCLLALCVLERLEKGTVMHASIAAAAKQSMAALLKLPMVS
jgi:hypothetical protein